MSPQGKTIRSLDKADGSGPSDVFQRDQTSKRAVDRIYRASRGLLLGLLAMFQLLWDLGIDLDLESLPEDDESASKVWKENLDELRETLIKVYDTADKTLEMALRAEKYLPVGQHEVMVSHVMLVRNVVNDVVPQELYDRVIGKGKGVAKGKAVKNRT